MTSDRADMLRRWHSGQTGWHYHTGNHLPGYERRTRLGKEVGSVRQPLEAWTYWKEGAGWMVVAPSGARIECVPTEAEARAIVARRNSEHSESFR